MPTHKLSDTEKKNNKIKKQTNVFMKSVRKFLESKNGGCVPPEWECSLMLLETYYFQFRQITEEIQAMESIIVDSKYGPAPTPLLSAQQSCAIRIETMMKELGLTFKSASKLNVVEPKPEETPLEVFIKKKQIEER